MLTRIRSSAVDFLLTLAASIARLILMMTTIDTTTLPYSAREMYRQIARRSRATGEVIRATVAGRELTFFFGAVTAR